MADQFDWRLIKAPEKHDKAIKQFLSVDQNANESFKKHMSASANSSGSTANSILSHHLEFVNLHDVLHSPPASPLVEKEKVESHYGGAEFDAPSAEAHLSLEALNEKKDSFEMSNLLEDKGGSSFSSFHSEHNPLMQLAETATTDFATHIVPSKTSHTDDKLAADIFDTSVDNILGKISSSGLFMSESARAGNLKSVNNMIPTGEEKIPFCAGSVDKHDLIQLARKALATPVASPTSSPDVHFVGKSSKHWMGTGSAKESSKNRSPALLLPQSHAPSVASPSMQHVEFILPTSQKASSRTVPSHNTRWSDEENALLKEAIHLYGWGKWKSISQHIGTRTPRQVKNHARDWHKKGEIEKTRVMKAANSAYTENRGKKSGLIGVVSGKTNSAKHLASHQHQGAINASNVLLEASNNLLESSAAAVAAAAAVNAVPSLAAAPNLSGFSQLFPALSGANDLAGNSARRGNTAQFVPVPHKFLMNFNTIEQLEREALPEWFVKTSFASSMPEQYVKIRNFIVQLWRQQFLPAGKQMTLASCLSALKADGDTQAIGRVYKFLEEMNLINCFQFTQYPPKVRVRKPSSDVFWSNNFASAFGGFANVSTAPHVPSTSAKAETVGNSCATGLVTPIEWQNPAFNVEISSNVIVNLELHAHISKHSAMGLLGGRLVLPPERMPGPGQNVQPNAPPARLYIMDSYATVSSSDNSGTQEDMNAAEGLKAFQEFDRKNLQVIGWYHAHPDSSPFPSKKDIDTQINWQQWYRSQVFPNAYYNAAHEIVSENVVPFVSIIVNPYDDRSVISSLESGSPVAPASQMSCTWVRVADPSTAGPLCLSPPRQIVLSEKLLLPEEVRDYFAELLRKHSTAETRVDLVSPIDYPPHLASLVAKLKQQEHSLVWSNRLEKLLLALENYIDFRQMGKDDWMAIMFEKYLYI